MEGSNARHSCLVVRRPLDGTPPRVPAVAPDVDHAVCRGRRHRAATSHALERVEDGALESGAAAALFDVGQTEPLCERAAETASTEPEM